MSRSEALALLAALPQHPPSPDRPPDPALWAAWCDALGRDPAPSNLWTELDVCKSAMLNLTRHVFKG